MNRVIAIVGMPGSGKSEAGKFFLEEGAVVLRFGKVVDEGLKEEELPQTPENEQYYREKVRKELGMAGMAIKMLPKIEEAFEKSDTVVLDGLYSWEEYLLLKEKYPTILLLLIYSRPSIRHERLAKRMVRPFTKEEAKERDIQEIEKLHKGGPIAMADFLIKNDANKALFIGQLVFFWKQFKADNV